MNIFKYSALVVCIAHGHNPGTVVVGQAQRLLDIFEPSSLFVRPVLREARHFLKITYLTVPYLGERVVPFGTRFEHVDGLLLVLLWFCEPNNETLAALALASLREKSGTV